MTLEDQKIEIGDVEYIGTVYDVKVSSTLSLDMNAGTMHNVGKFDLLETTYTVSRSFNMMLETTATSTKTWRVY